MQKIDHDSWVKPFDVSTKCNAIKSLENGKIIFLPNLSFEIKREEQVLLSPQYGNGKSKNISYDARNDRLRGVKESTPHLDEIKKMMSRFHQYTLQLISNLFPTYVPQIEVARTSYRPVEILGRKAASYKKDDTRLHVDAFPASPVQGRRILRVFSNINPFNQDRVWRVGEPFESLAKRFLSQIKKPRVSGALLKNLKITKGIRTYYDHLMLQLHDRMKADEAYQKQVQKTELRLPPNSTWIVYTDVVSHAVMSGQFLLEQTFHLPVSAMENENRSPLRILETELQKELL